jgi:hypothetical protein
MTLAGLPCAIAGLVDCTSTNTGTCELSVGPEHVVRAQCGFRCVERWPEQSQPDGLVGYDELH